MVATLTQILLGIGTRLLTKKVVKEVLAAVIDWAVKSSKTEVDNDIAKPILENLRS